VNKIIEVIERKRRLIGFTLLPFGIAASLIMLLNFSNIHAWFMAITGADHLPKSTQGSWVGLFLLIGLSLCIGALLRPKKNSSDR